MRNKRVQVIQIPFDSGNRGVRMGSGPEYLIAHGLELALLGEGYEVSIETIEPKTDFRAEIRTQFELYEKLAGCVAQAYQEEKFPLILSGNCGASLGAIAGAQNRNLGLVWFDAHGDFNTPETTTSGFLDGMGLAIAAGLCWQKMTHAIPNFTPVEGKKILHVGGRDFDAEEKAMFGKVGVAVVETDEIRQTGVRDALETPLLKLRSNVEKIHIHIDLDVLNPKEAPANEYVTEEGGLSVENVVEAIAFIKESVEINSATIAAFDPKFDTSGKTLQAGLKLISKILE